MPSGGVRDVKLDRNKQYSVQDIINFAETLFFENKAICVFGETSQLNYKLGYYDGTVIKKFLDFQGNPSDLWKYFSERGITLSRHNIYFITEMSDQCETVVDNMDVDNIDDVIIKYLDINTSKYSGNISTCEKTMRDIYEKLINNGNEVQYSQFNPIDFGYPISTVEKDGNVLLNICVDQNLKKNYKFRVLK